MLSKVMEYVFEALVIGSVFLVLFQIQTADCVDKLRQNDTRALPFRMRRVGAIVEIVALCFTASYSYGWEPWPPLIALIVAFDVRVIAQIMVLTIDKERLERLEMIASRGRVIRSGPSGSAGR